MRQHNATSASNITLSPDFDKDDSRVTRLVVPNTATVTEVVTDC